MLQWVQWPNIMPLPTYNSHLESIKIFVPWSRESERDRQTDRGREGGREGGRERERERGGGTVFHYMLTPCSTHWPDMLNFMHWTALDKPPCSPDLSPCQVHGFWFSTMVPAATQRFLEERIHWLVCQWDASLNGHGNTCYCLYPFTHNKPQMVLIWTAP